MTSHQPTLEALGDHDYLLHFSQDQDTFVVRMHADQAVVEQIADDEQRVVEATAAYLLVRQSVEDLPEQIDLDTVAAAYDGYIADLHRHGMAAGYFSVIAQCRLQARGGSPNAPGRCAPPLSQERENPSYIQSFIEEKATGTERSSAPVSVENSALRT